MMAADEIERADEKATVAPLRLTPTPLHSDESIEALVTALSEVWRRLTLRRAA